MNVTETEELVRELYEDDRDKLGYPAIEHIARVVREAVKDSIASDPVETVGWLHDAVEDGKLSFRQVYERWDEDVFLAILYLTRDGKQTYMDYIRMIRDLPPRPGRICRTVKLADLRDNMARPCPTEMTGMREPGGRYYRALAILEGRSA